MNNEIHFLQSFLFFITITFLTIFMALLPSYAMTNDFSPDREELMFMDIPIVVTASKMNQKLTDAPATMIVVSKQQILERGYQNLLDLLEDMPGIDVQNNSGQEIYNLLAIRGNYGQDKFIIMRDSHRVNAPASERLPISDNFPLFNVKQVEIVYGPASALYGADAFTGVINIISEDADDINGIEMSVSAGSFDHYYGYLKYGQSLSNNVKLTVGGHWHQSDNADLSKYYDEYAPADITLFDSTTVAAADREEFTFKTASHSGLLKLDIDDKFTLGYNRSFFRHPTTAGVQPDQSSFGDEVRWETALENYYGEYRFDSGDKASGKTSINYLTYELLPDSKYKHSWDGFREAFKYSRSSRFSLEQQVNYQWKDSQLFSGGFLLEKFYALPKTANLNKPYDPDIPSTDQGHFYEGTNNEIPLKIFELNYTNNSAYLQLHSSWSKVAATTLGLRVDDNSRYGDSINPRVSLVLTPRETTTLKVLYGEAFLAPAPYWAYAHFGSFDGTTNIDGDYVNNGWFGLPNPGLEPEKSRTFEVNLSEKISPDLNTSISAYFTRVDNLIIGEANYTVSHYIEGGAIDKWTHVVNGDHAIFYGGELTVDYNLLLHGVKTTWWGNYSYANGYLVDNNIEKEHMLMAHHKVKGGVTMKGGNYFVTPSFRWIGKTNSTRTDSNNAEKRMQANSYVVVNLHMGINEISENLSATLTIDNLLDKRYYNGGAGSSNFVSTPQEPRKIIFTLKYKL